MSTTTPGKQHLPQLDSSLVPKFKFARSSGNSSPGAAATEGLFDWDRWVRYLALRKQPKPLAKLIPEGHQLPLEWALPAELPEDTVRLVSWLGRVKKKKRPEESDEWEAAARGWLAEAQGRQPDADYALECLAWCHALPRLGARLTGGRWWEVLQHLLQTARDGQGSEHRQCWLTAQLVSGELPLTLAYCFPEISACRALARPAGEVLSEGLIELLDGAGLPHASHLPLLRPLMASWTRAGLLDRAGKKRRISKTARHQYAWLVRQALRLTRFDGRQVLDNSADDAPCCSELYQAALILDDDATDQLLAARLLSSELGENGKSTPTPKSTPKSKSKPKSSGQKLPWPGEHSEWGELAVLRTAWSPTAPMLAVTYDGGRLTSEFTAHRRVVWSGKWDAEIRVDGQLPAGVASWSENCWETDRDVDYVELEAEWSNGLKLQRQILLARDDLFLFVADAVLCGDSPQKIDYFGCLPLVAPVRLEPAEGTSEAFLLADRKRIGTVLPLALPEWRSESRQGSMDSTSAALQQVTTGRALYAPLFVDLDPGRKRKSLTWRQLTVAERLEIVPADVAVAYRVQVGRQQWLFYRSLAPAQNRTVLGQNLSTEFLAARFGRDGETETLIEIL